MQTPREEVAERVAEAAPGLVTAAALDAVQNQRLLNADHRRRLHEGHRWQAEALGKEVADLEDDPVGDLSISGDTYVYGADAAEIVKSMQSKAETSQPQPDQPGPQTTTPDEHSGPGRAKNWMKAAAIAAGLLGASGLGAGVPWLLGFYEKTAPINTTTGTSQVIGVDVIPGGALSPEGETQ